MARRRGLELTERQAEILRWIESFAREHGVPPTVREIGRAFGIRSSSVFNLLKTLERKGQLRRCGPGARSLVLKNITCGCRELPVKGRIAAGKPIFAAEDDLGTVTVDAELLKGRAGYALRVEGDSMVDADILDGDYVVIRAQDTAEDGDIVVALIEDEATLKRFYREKNRVRLEPANRRMKAIRVSSGEFRIQGKVVEVKRLLEKPPP